MWVKPFLTRLLQDPQDINGHKSTPFYGIFKICQIKSEIKLIDLTFYLQRTSIFILLVSYFQRISYHPIFLTILHLFRDFDTIRIY